MNALEAAADELRAVERERGVTPTADLLVRDERAVLAYDRAVFALGLACGRDAEEASATTLTAIRQKAWEKARTDLLFPRPRLRLVPPLVGDGRTPVQRLAAALGWTVQKTYRNLPRMPGVEKNDPAKAKSHWNIPDPEGSAGRWLTGERKER